MPTWNLESYKERLLQALTCYEHKVSRTGSNINPQRRKDLTYLRECVQLIQDDILLDRELRTYLAQMKTSPTWYTLYFYQKDESELRAMIEAIMVDEQIKYMQQYQEHKTEVMKEVMQLNKSIMNRWREDYQQGENNVSQSDRGRLITNS